MRLLLSLIAVLSLALPQAHAARPQPTPQLLAVYVYADWCPNCKILSPALAKARVDGALDKKDVLFVTLNLTDKPAIRQSQLLASALGIGDYLQAQGSGTGYVAILDAKSKKELARFDSESDAKAIGAGIQKLLR